MVSRSSGRDHDESGSPGKSVEGYPLPPGPNGYPLVGNTVSFFRGPFDFYEMLAEYGDVVRWRLPRFPFTTLFHPDYVEQVLVEDHDRYERNLLGDFDFDFAPGGIFSVQGETWRSQRQLMQPAFTMGRIQSYADTMSGYAERLASSWNDGQEIAVNRAFSELSLRILSKALFDVDVDPNEDDEVIPRAARLINRRVDAGRVTTFLPTWVPTPSNRRYRQTMAEYRDRVSDLIDSKHEGGKDADDLLSVLLHAEGPDGYTLSETEIRDNLLTFMFAGHETTSLGLTWTVHLLARHDEAATRLREECETVVGSETPAVEHVPRLDYTEQVVKESMRLRPPAHLLTRRATEDTVVGGYRVPEGTILTLPQFSIHTDERFYDDPDAFRPARWTDEFEDALPEYAYFPFGGGPRHCIGMRFAMLEVQLVVAVLARRFEFELLSDPNPDISTGPTHKPTEAVRVRVYRL